MKDYDDISKVADITIALYIKEIKSMTPYLEERIDIMDFFATIHFMVAEEIRKKMIDALYDYHDLAAMPTEGKS